MVSDLELQNGTVLQGYDAGQGTRISSCWYDGLL